MLRKSDKSSAATGALAAETAAGGDGTAVEAAGDSPNLRRGFAERPVGVKTAKIYLADARAAEMSAARTDANVGVVLNRIADASDGREDEARSANKLDADRIAMNDFADPAHFDSPEAAQFLMVLGKTMMLTQARAALARSQAPGSVDAPASESTDTPAPISAGAAMANGPVGVEQAVAGGAPSGAGAPANGGRGDDGAGGTVATEGTQVSAVRETPVLGANDLADCKGAQAAGAAVGASAAVAPDGAARGVPERAAAAHPPVARLGGGGRGVKWVAGAAVSGLKPASSTRPAALRAPSTSSPVIVTWTSKRRAGAARATAAKRSRTVPESADLSATSSANDPNSTTAPKW